MTEKIRNATGTTVVCDRGAGGAGLAGGDRGPG